MKIEKSRNINLKKQEKRIREKKKIIEIVNYLLETRYVYNFDWLGVPSIQFPSDLLVIQELLFDYKPDIIIETGVAHGGTLIFYSSIMSLIKKNYQVYGIDIKIKKINRKKITSHPFSKKITLIEKNSTDELIPKIFSNKTKNKKVLVLLDSYHSHEHVLKEIDLYSKFIKKGGYIVVMDTTTEFVKKKFINKNRNFGKGNSPFTAVKSFIKKNKDFKICRKYENKAFITSCFDGFLIKK